MPNAERHGTARIRQAKGESDEIGQCAKPFFPLADSTNSHVSADAFMNAYMIRASVGERDQGRKGREMGSHGEGVTRRERGWRGGGRGGSWVEGREGGGARRRVGGGGGKGTRGGEELQGRGMLGRADVMEGRGTA